MKQENQHTSWIYFGAFDERVKAGINRAGYQAFLLLVVLIPLDLILHALAFKQDRYPGYDVIVIILIAEAFFIGRCLRFRVTFTKSQRSFISTFLIVVLTIFTALRYTLIAVNGGRRSGPLARLGLTPEGEVVHSALPAVSGLALYFVVRFLFLAYNKMAERGIDRELDKDPDGR